MSLDEFQVIDKYFKKHFHRDDVELGIGDDCAVLSVVTNKKLVVTTDTLNVGVHFFPHPPPLDIGYKAIAVSLSDIAAMGGDPQWALLSLTLPTIDENWLADFSKGMFACLDQFGVQLVGGNMSRGPLAITTQLMGSVSSAKYLTRAGAKPGDKIYVTGTLGDGGLALALLQNKISNSIFSTDEQQQFLRKLWRPTPRIAEGKLLTEIATAAIDISDGLAADLQHLLSASKVGATLNLQSLPMSTALKKLPPEKAALLALTAGDDYELCFTVPPENLPMLGNIINQTNLTCIGQIDTQIGLRVYKSDGMALVLNSDGYKHWASM